MTNLLTVVATMRAKPGKEEALRQAALAIVMPTRAEEGCVQYDLHVNTRQPGLLVFYENWTDEEALAKHAASTHIKKFAEVRAELLAEPASVETYRRIA